MAWVKLDDAMPHHPKVMAAGPQAFALDVAGICYSNRFALDGFILDDSLSAVCPSLRNPKKWADVLVEVGRWERVDDGWRIHDIGDYQPTALEQKEISKKRAAAGRKGGIKSGQARTKQNASDSEPTTKQVASTETNPDPTRPTSSNEDGLFEVFYHFWTGQKYSPGTSMPSTQRGRINAAVKEARLAGIDKAEVYERGRRYIQLWSGLERTPQALLANWHRFAPEPVVPDCSNCDSTGLIWVTDDGHRTRADDPDADTAKPCPECAA